VKRRVRLVVGTAVLTLLALGASFWGVARIFNRSQERELDIALLAAADEAARHAVTPTGELAIADGPGPAVNDSGPLPRYGAVYDELGTPRAATATFEGSPPLTSVLHGDARPFDFSLHELRLRAVMVPVERHPGAFLLLAIPRTDIDGDATFLARALASVLAVACLWSLLLALWLIHRLTGDQQAIADVVSRVARGDLRARVQSQSRDPETHELAGSVDAMIETLGVLLDSQRKFVAYAAHELRAPLTLVHGQLALALRRPRGEQEYRSAIGEALSAANDLRTLTDELLDLARAGAPSQGPRVPTSVPRVVRAAVRYVEPIAEAAGVGIELRVEDAFVPGRASDLERLVRNLVENAIRHSPRGGRVMVDASERDGSVEICVTDEGAGVPEPDRARLFEPFFRGQGAVDGVGAGLGLAIAREIARAHDGDIHYDGSVSRGARFVIQLPTVPQARRGSSSGLSAIVHVC
jgi:two-component system heavy metal sensor histidine kinase CusS